MRLESLNRRLERRKEKAEDAARRVAELNDAIDAACAEEDYDLAEALETELRQLSAHSSVE